MDVSEMLTELGDHIAGITNDSRKVREGYVYVAVRGCMFNGEDFMQDAVDKGAVALVTELEDSRCDIVTVTVDDARKALAELSCIYNRWPSRSLYLAGITGTNGKTTTAYLIHRVFEDAGRAVGLMSTVEHRVGDRIIPATRTTMDAPDLQAALSEMVRAGCDSAVMEVSSHAIDQKRVAFVEFDAMVFTNLSRDHLDYHESMEKYFQAKKQVFLDAEDSTKETVKIINADDEYGRRMINSDDLRGRVISYGLDSEADIRALDVKVTPEGSVFTVVSPWGEAEFSTPLIGRYNVSNILAAAAVCSSAGIALGQTAASVSAMCQVPGRLEEVETGGRAYKVFVDYAHTDDALEQMLSGLREITSRRLIIVFGCGGDRDRSKRPEMGRVAGALADYVFLTSDNPRSEEPMAILEEVKSGFNGFCNYKIIESRRDAIRSSLEMAGEGDVVVVAGKGHESFQEMSRTTVPFDDRHVIMEVLEDL